MKKLVVMSGATGMSGSETVKQLLAKGYDVVGFDNFFASSIQSISTELKNPQLRFFELDMNRSDDLLKIENEVLEWQAKNSGEVSFINYAAVVHTKYFYDPEATFNTNVIAMKEFLELAIRVRANKFINCSTSEVYSLGSFKEGGVKESDPLTLATAEVSQRTSYATGKLMTEFFMKSAVDSKKIKGCSIRFANVYSDDELYPEHIIPYAIDSLMKGNSIQLLENAKTTRRTFLHNFDSCSSVIALLEKDEALDGSIYNVGTTEEVNIVDLVKDIGLKLGKPEIQIQYKGARTADPERRLLNIDKIKLRTGWSPKVNLSEGLSRAIQHRKK